ncbi:MAG TPA: methyltransferase domain-containing protein [Kofleriaceae bacterium]|nr:methyltransferase domain-containing protein [Kofleriaceae bacterium]
MSNAFHEFERSGWQRAAAHYAGTFGAVTAQAAEPLLDAARVTSGSRVLDVATGPGYVAAAAAKRGAHVVAVDFAPAMIADAQRAHPDVLFRVGDAEALAEPDRAYDAIVMAFGLLHLARPEAAIAEAHRVLVPGGHFAFTVWAPPTEAVGFGIVLDAIDQHGTRAVDLPEGPPFFRYSDHDECRRALAAFGDVEVRTVPVVWRLTSPDQLFAAALHGGVRTSALLRAQPRTALVAIEQAVTEAVSGYRDRDAFALPMSFVLASARV